MAPQLKDGSPTGRLNDYDMMEIECYIQDGNQKIPCGVRWIPITPEQRAEIMGQNNVAVSMGASIEAVKSAQNTQVNVDDNMRATFVLRGKNPSIGHLDEAGLSEGGNLKVRACVGSTGPDQRGNAISKEALLTETARSLAKQKDFMVQTLATDQLATLSTQQITELSGVTMRAINVTDASIQPSMLATSRPTTEANKPVPGTYSAFTLQANGEIVDHGKLPLVGGALIDDGNVSRNYADAQIMKAHKPAAENSGGNVNYYSVPINHPKRPERVPYVFEVEDLIQALNLNFHEGTILKSLVRSATERELGLAKQGNDSIRDAEKMVHSATEELRARKLKRDGKW